jgi:phenylacetate-CoA ligase
VTPEEYANTFDQALATVVPDAAERVPAFAARLSDAGLEPRRISSVEELDRLPILSKDNLVEIQAADPPFGGLLATDARARRVFQSPGPLYEPELEDVDAHRWRPALEAAGFGPGDVVLNTFGYHLSPAGAMLEQAAVAAGGTVVPAGVGQRELQAQACADVGVTAYIGLPSYLKALLEAGEELGLRPAEWPLQRAFVSAEPLPPSLREWLRGYVPTVRQGYGTAELGNLGYECEREEGLHVPDDALVQVCDLQTGTARWDGATGQVVVTLLRSDYPLVRFGTGDLSAFLLEGCRCGRDTPRLAGFLGRVGEAVKVRGMFLHPRQVQDVMAGLDEVRGYRFVVDRVNHKDVLRCEAVSASAVDEEELRSGLRRRIRDGLRFDAEVVLMGELPEGAPVVDDVRSWE